MSALNGRRATNMTQFMQSLNEDATIDAAAEIPFVDEQMMAMFTNSEFYDFETGQSTDYQHPPAKPESDRSKTEDPAPTTSILDEFNNVDFPMSGEYNFQDFGNSYASPTITSFPDGLGNLPPIQPNPQQVYAAIPHQQHQHNGYMAQTSRIADKQGPDALSPTGVHSPDDPSRHAAEEDKRRRNTAASARFRIKKKQREQALEKSAKDMTEKVTALEGRISQLETENKWLKNIVLEKNDGNEDLVTKLLEEYHAKSQAQLKEEAEAASNLKAPTSPEERDAGDSSG